jgi:Tol biopolymer transport system component
MLKRASWLRRLVVGLVVGPVALLASAAVSPGPEVVSIGLEGAGDADSHEGTISANGRYVAFRSYASNLDPVVAGVKDHVYLKDRVEGTMTIVSRTIEDAFSDGSYNPQVSANGRWVLFQTYTPGLDPADGSGDSDLFLWDRNTREHRIVSLNAQGESGNSDVFMDGASLSSNGRYGVAYSTATNLTGDTVGGTTEQVFWFDFKKGTVVLVSKGIGGAAADLGCYRPSISANGRWVVFDSAATNLLPGVGNGVYQVFAWDAKTKALSLVSRTPAGDDGDDESYWASVANNGVVSFTSEATDLLAPAKLDNEGDVYVFDPRRGGSTRRISEESPGVSPDGDAGHSSISQSGKTVVFSTDQSLVSSDDNGNDDVYAWDAAAGTVRLLSGDGDGNTDNASSEVTCESLSRNGKWSVFASTADIFAGEANGSIRDVIAVSAKPK